MQKLMSLIQEPKTAYLLKINDQELDQQVSIQEIQTLIEIAGRKFEVGSIVTIKFNEFEFKVKVLDSHKNISMTVLI